ncbi:MAG: 50S ribosomal protein L18e [Thermoplasmatota archaeon]
MSIENKTNPILVQLVEELKEKSRKEEAPIWRDVAERLEKPSKNWAEVNLSAIERHTEEGDTIVIPGKVLGSGYLTKNVTVGSFKFSKSAKKSIEEAGGKSITIRKLADQNPKGSGVKIIG